MALLESSLLFQDSVVRLRATAADGVKMRALLSSSGPPLRLEIVDERVEGNKSAAVPLLATIIGGKDKETPTISRAVPFLLQPGGVASLRLDNLLSELIETSNKAWGYSSIPDAMGALSLSGSPPHHIFSVSVHFASSRFKEASRMFPISTVTIRAEGINFLFSRELLCLQSEFFCAFLYGPFAESGKDLVKLETFTAEEIDTLHRTIQCGLPIKRKNVITTLAVADRVLSPSLKARIASLPIPKSQEKKEEWLLGADTYNNMELASKIVFSILPNEAAAIHVKLAESISNEEIHQLFVTRASGKLLPWLHMDTFIAIEMSHSMGHLGTVRIRLFTVEMLDVAEEIIEILPRTVFWSQVRESHVFWLLAGPQSRPRPRYSYESFFRARDFLITTPCTMRRSHEGWTLCTKKSGIYLKRSCTDNDEGFIPIGEVVDGANILEHIYCSETKSVVRVE